ncbi:MAG: ribosome biogenesis GTPase Der [Candidatus Hatepunaea meridiana]|nr:ribosome biogenesis GTPase Der [Candidatus Hatepunaea meridiana]
MPLPIVTIVGRPNVGKSTLFNRIIRRRVAVVDPIPGVTRDRHYAETEWGGIRFTLVDTGGYLPESEGGELTKAVSEQTLIAAQEADLVLFIADVQTGTSEIDIDLAHIILKQNVPVVFIANKVDDPQRVALAWDLQSIGMGDPIAISALTGFQIGDLLDEICSRLNDLKPILPDAPSAEELSLAIIGAPNSGKSSLVNRLAGTERMVVSDIPGTTRDAVDTIIQYHGKRIRLIDTAGLKRKRFGQQGLEFYCTLRALRALERCDVAIVMIDGIEGLTQGDIKLVNQAAGNGVGVILVVNKWDAVEKDPKNADRWLLEWKRKAPSLNWVPVLFISALTGHRSIKVIEEALVVKTERERRIKTSELNDKIGYLLARTPPPATKGKYFKIRYGTQVKSAPPRFAFFTRHAGLIREPYKRFVEKIIREKYGFRGVPVSVVFREKKD